MHFSFPPPLHARLCCLDPLRFIADKQAREPTADALNGGFHTVLHLILMIALYGDSKQERTSPFVAFAYPIFFFYESRDRRRGANPLCPTRVRGRGR